MSLVPAAVEPSPVAQRASSPRDTRASWLILGGYLLGALAVTARLWADPAGQLQIGDAHDVNMFAWFMRYSATAVGHGHLPALFTTALNPPRGVNLMWNTSLLLPGMLLAPVTLLAGPQVSLTIVLTLSLAGSAASLFWVLRRWGASTWPAALGGAVYGFSPAMINSGIGHYNLVLAVLPPLIIDALCRVVSGARPAAPHDLSVRADPGSRAGRPRRLTPPARYSIRMGAWLGLLTAAQLLIGEEALVYTAVAGLVLVAVAGLSHPRAVPRRARHAALGLATGTAVTLLICWYPLWVQFRGPLREHSVLQRPWSGNLALFVDPSANLLFHTPASVAVLRHAGHGLPEVLSYLGWPLIVVLVAAAAAFWSDLRVRAAAVTCAVLELCNLGGGVLPVGGFRLPGAFLPYHWVQSLPVVAQVIPDRFCILGAGAAGAVLAFALDRARSARPAGRRWQRRLPAAVAVLAVLPLIPVPYRTGPVRPTPAGWQAAFAGLRLPADAPVLVVPVPLIANSAPMRWQADTGQPASLIGGYIIEPSTSGEAVFRIGPGQTAAEDLNLLWAGRPVRNSYRPAVQAALRYWRPAAVVAVTPAGSPLERFLARLLGPPASHVRRVLVWRL